MITVPFHSLEPIHNQVQKEVKQALVSVCNTNRFILGPEGASFEREYARYSGVRYCVGFANGLDALYAALKLLGIKQEDEVIVPTHTYIATWLAITRVGARIIPIDVDPNTMLMDARQVERAITIKTKVILPVHLYGRLCDMTLLTDLATHYKLKIVEDNAQAHGASRNKKKSGSFGDCNASSFYPTKNLGALGDGGALTTESKQIYQRALAFRNYGATARFVNPNQGINSRLDELQAAVLRIKLNYLDSWNKKRAQIAQMYFANLAGLGDLVLPEAIDYPAHVYHLFVIRTNFRDRLQTFLMKKGVESMIHYPIPCHVQGAYSHLGYKKGTFPVSESIARTALSLPLWSGLPEDHVHYVCACVEQFFQKM